MERNHEKNRKALKDLGILMLILCIPKIVSFIVSVFSGVLNTANYVNEVAADMVGALHALVIITLSISVISILLQVFLGCRAIQLADAPTKSRSHINLSIFITVINIILAIIAAIALFNSTNVLDDVLNLLFNLATAAIFILYTRTAKLVRKERDMK